MGERKPPANGRASAVHMQLFFSSVSSAASAIDQNAFFDSLHERVDAIRIESNPATLRDLIDCAFGVIVQQWLLNDAQARE